MTDLAIRLVILDAGPIIHLDELGVLRLLEDFHARLAPDAVWLEVERHRPGLFERHPLLFTRISPQERQSATLGLISKLLQPAKNPRLRQCPTEAAATRIGHKIFAPLRGPNLAKLRKLANQDPMMRWLIFFRCIAARPALINLVLLGAG